MNGPDTISALQAGRITDPRERLEATTSLMEASFYEELFKAMRDTVPEGGLLDGGQGEDIFSSFLDRHLAETQALRAGTGLGDALYRHFAGTAGVEPTSPEPTALDAPPAASQIPAAPERG